MTVGKNKGGAKGGLLHRKWTKLGTESPTDGNIVRDAICYYDVVQQNKRNVLLDIILCAHEKATLKKIQVKVSAYLI